MDNNLPPGLGYDDFDNLMRRHGFYDFEYEPVEGNPEVIGQIWDTGFPPAGSRTAIDSFFSHFGDTTFRKLLRYLFDRRQLTFEELNKFCSNINILNQHLAYMTEKRIVIQEGNFWKVAPRYNQINDIGKTLEWYIAEWFMLTLNVPARYGVKIKGIADGGDLDVVAFVGEKRLFIESKSGHPNYIEERHLDLFLRRIADFKPTTALLLIDTDMDINKQLEMIRTTYAKSDIVGHRNLRGKGLDLGSIFVRNTKKGIDKSLQAVLRITSADDFYDRPLLTVTQQYIQRVNGIIDGLDKFDSLVMKLVCEQAITLNSNLLNSDALFEHPTSQTLSQEEVFESLEVLDGKGYIDIIPFAVRESCTFWITPAGFEKFASIFIEGYELLINQVLELIVVQDVDDNKTLRAKTNAEQQTVNFILKNLELRGAIDIRESGSTDNSGLAIKVHNVSTEMRRKFRQ